MIDDTKELRDAIDTDEIVVTSNSTRCAMHLGDDDGNILCSCNGYTKKPLFKSIDVIPVGYYGWCSRCIDNKLDNKEDNPISI